jgi:hypothetical protein
MPNIFPYMVKNKKYGDGTELDGIDDLSFDKDFETKFIKPKHERRSTLTPSVTSSSGVQVVKKGKNMSRGASLAVEKVDRFKKVGKTKSGGTSTRDKQSSPKKPHLIRNLSRASLAKGE